MHWMLKMELRN